jgi:hypothetical protein
MVATWFLFQERSLSQPQRRSMVPITKIRGSQVPGPLLALGLPLAILTASTLSAGPASALVTLDSTNNGAFSVATSTANQGVSNNISMMRAFQMGTLDSYLSNLRIAYSLPFSTTTPNAPSELILKVEAFKVTLNPSNVYVPTGPSLGSFTTTLLPTTSANSSQYTANLAVSGSLASVLFQSGQSYGFVFSNGTAGSALTIGLRRCGGSLASPTPSGCLLTPNGTPALAFGGVSYLGGSRLASGVWSTPVPLNNSLIQQYTFTPVPAPAFMGVSYLGGLLLGSRRLRSRIRKSAV